MTSQPQTVLIIDDANDSRFSMRSKIEQMGLLVDEADSARSAVAYLMKQQPVLVLLKIKLSQMDGFQLLKAIKNERATANLPVFMIASQGDPIPKDRYRAVGALGVINENISRGRLLEVFKRSRLFPGLEPVQSVQTRRGGSLGELLDQVERLTPDQAVEHGGVSGHLADLGSESELLGRAGPSQRVRHAEIGQEQGDKITPLLEKQSRIGGYWVPALLVLSLGMNLHHYVNSSDQRQQIWDLQTQLQQIEERTIQRLQQETDYQYATRISTSRVATVARDQEKPRADSAIKPDPIDPLPFEFGQRAFGEQAVPWLQGHIETLASKGFKGTIRMIAHLGRYCVEDERDQTPAADEIKLDECRFSPSAPALAIQQGGFQDIGFTNLVTDTEERYNNRIRIETSSAGIDEPREAYPKLTDAESTAKEWNAIAAVNQRIEVELVQQP